MRVTVGVLTYRRPELLGALLPKLQQQVDALPPGFVGRVLIVDNDPAASAREVVPVENYVHEPTPGIAAARNRALAEASGDDFIAFMDDDELPGDRWLTLLIETWQHFGHPAAVAGRVLPRYQATPPPWVLDGGFFVRRSLPTGAEVQAAATSNLLVDLAQLRELGLTFDHRLGLAGGEDTLLTRSLTVAGRRIVWCEEAETHDLVPADRMTRLWVRRRGFSHGVAHATVERELRPGAATRLRLVGGGLARVPLAAFTGLWGLVGGDRRAKTRAAWLAARGLGIAWGGIGGRHQEYARD